MKPLLIESSSEMDALLGQIIDQPIIAIDTEFQRETTYYPKLALVQIATDTLVMCIDPLAFDARPALQKILLDPKIIKVFHSCSQDLEVLFYYLGNIPCEIYDTQIANAFLTENHQIGYASLVENELSIQLDKSQTRTNWLQRPLTDKQIQYAGDDVFYLYQLQDILSDKLQRLGRRTWFIEECRHLSDDANDFQVDTKKLWRRVKGASTLDRSKLAILQCIAEWREQLAQIKDKTRRRVLADDTLIQLAIGAPETTDSLERIINSKDRRQLKLNDDEKQQLIQAIASAQNVPESEWPDNRYSILDNQQKAVLKTLQQSVNEKARELSMASAIICSRKDLENLLLSHTEELDENPPGLSIVRGWRLHCIGQQLLDTLKSLNK